MADITITFENKLNHSLQIGDMIYFEKSGSVAELGLALIFQQIDYL